MPVVNYAWREFDRLEAEFRPRGGFDVGLNLDVGSSTIGSLLGGLHFRLWCRIAERGLWPVLSAGLDKRANGAHFFLFAPVLLDHCDLGFVVFERLIL